jgi:putative ABC transport system ATP-binding protein
VPVSESVARCRGVTVDYDTAAGAVRALHEVDAEFLGGRLTVVAGPSGSGKSSLLRVLAGLQRPTAGDVYVDGADLGRLRAGPLRRLRRRAMGIVLQDPADNLVDYLPAAEQVELAARLRGADPAETGALLDTAGLTDRARSYPAELSGGEQQRVAFAAAAIGGPALLLADEPTAELDASAGDRLVETMRSLVAGGATLVVASHDPAVIAAADHVVDLRDGRRMGAG